MAATSTRRFCTFRVGGMTLGLDVRSVEEVVRHRPTTPVPHAPPEVRGLMNLRGRVVPAIDLRVRLGMPPFGPDDRPDHVVCRVRGGPVGLLVDEVGEVVEAEADRVEPVPGGLPEAVRERAAGIIEDRGALVVLLSPGRAAGAAPGDDGPEWERD